MDRKEEDVPIHAARSHLEEQRALVNSQLARVAKAVLHAQKMHGLAGCLGILEKKFRLVRAVAARHTSLHRGTRLMRVGPFFFCHCSPRFESLKPGRSRMQVGFAAHAEAFDL